MNKNGPLDFCIWMLGPKIRNYLGRIRMYGLVGVRLSLGVNFEVSKSPAGAVSLYVFAT